MRVVLISTYELGHQPFGLASPAAWLRRAGFEVACADVSRQPLRAEQLAGAGLVAFYLPMHTATRLALRLLPQVQAAAPGAHLCGYGLYAPIQHQHLTRAGMQTLLGGEFEAELTELARRLARGEPAAAAASQDAIPRLAFVTPDRAGLPPLDQYARLQMPDGAARVAGYTEASRGCKHQCRHCPIVPVYGGQFRVVAREVVLADIRQQVEAGAEHITFGDPDFFNGPTHALRIVEELHREFPALSYDAVIKVEHLLKHAGELPRLRATGCALITTAVESFDDAVLTRLEKDHTRADIFHAVELARAAGLALNPTFVSFTPWTTPASFAEMCGLIEEHGLIEQIAPVQYGIRLLIPEGSRILELPESAEWLDEFDPAALSYRWRYATAERDEVEALCERVQATVAQCGSKPRSRAAIFDEVARVAAPARPRRRVPQAAALPYLSEPWFCCAEPTSEQFARMIV